MSKRPPSSSGDQSELPLNNTSESAASAPAAEASTSSVTPTPPAGDALATVPAAAPEAPKTNEHAPLAASYKTRFLDYASYVSLDG